MFFDPQSFAGMPPILAPVPAHRVRASFGGSEMGGTALIYSPVVGAAASEKPSLLERDFIVYPELADDAAGGMIGVAAPSFDVRPTTANPRTGTQPTRSSR